MKRTVKFSREYTHDGTDYEKGQTVELVAKQAEALITLGVAEAVGERTGEGVVHLTEEQFERLLGANQPPDEDVDKETENLSSDGQNRKMPDLDVGSGAKGMNANVGEDREMQDPRHVALHTIRMLSAQALGTEHSMLESACALVGAGAYGEEARAAGDFYSTVVDADGGILLPTQVVSVIEELAEQFGAARQLARTYTNVVGDLKVPAASGQIVAAAVAEGGVITSSKRAFEAVTLNPQKWASIIPWTYEANLELATQILDDLQRAVASAFAKAEDDTMINGDGTSSFNSITGILNTTGVGELVLAAGETGFADITADELVFAINEVHQGARPGASFVFHPDMEPVLRTLKDGNGQYIYSYDDTGRPSVAGRRVVYTSVLPSLDQSAISTSFGILGDFEYWKLALGQGMTSERLSEGTVTDADTGAEINLATQDLRALKVREFFDMSVNLPAAFAKLTTAAT